MYRENDENNNEMMNNGNQPNFIIQDEDYNNGNQSNNFENNNGNPNNNYQNQYYQTVPTKKVNKKRMKVVGIIAAGLAIAMTSGLTGGLIAYNAVKKSQTTEVQSKSYAPPQFTSSTDGAMSASEAFEKVKPAVVTISVKGIQSYYGYFQQEVSGIGSGFIINEDGYILTNYHVIENAQEVTVLLSTGEEVKASVVNYDQAKDMAMIKLEDGTKVPGVAELGDSDALYPGEDVIAIGTPLSTEFAQTMTKGVVSAVNRTVSTESGTTMTAIQTDAAINPGNSGGPLVNTKGQVIGINSMKLAENSVEGMGFAIPINEAKDRIESLSKPILTLGITVREIDSATAKKNDWVEGLLIKDISTDSYAERAGLKIGDIITKFDGKRVKTFDELNEIKNSKQAGDKIEVVVDRNGKDVTVTLELNEK